MEMKRPIPWFSCKNDSQNHHLKNLWSFDVPVEKESHVLFTPSQTLFGKSVSIHTIYKESTFLFMDIKKNCHFIKAFLDYSSDAKPCDLEKSRKDVCEALYFILANFKAMRSFLKDKQLANTSSISDMLSSILKELMKLLFFVGRVGNLSNIPLTDLLETRNSMFYHGIHLYLDVWSIVLALLPVISGFPVSIDNIQTLSNEVGYGNPLTQVAMLLMTDLICIALKTYKSMKELFVTSPFFCRCVQDVWIVLIKILDERSSTANDTFWNNYLVAVQKIHAAMVQDSQQEENDFASLNLDEISQENFIEGVLWVTSYVAPLYKHEYCGNGESIKSCYNVVNFMIHLLLLDDRKEKTLRCSLFYTVHLISLWEANSKFLIPVIEFFIKKVDRNFSVPETGLGGMSCLHKSAGSWYQSLNILSTPCKTWEGETSFCLFLRLLLAELSKNDVQGHRAIKSSFYCKFLKQKIMSFTEIGLQNMFSILLILVKSGQTEVLNKICDFASALEETPANPKKQAVAWKSLFVLIYLHQKNPIDLNKVLVQLTKYFDSACSKYSLSNRDRELRTSIMNLLMIYIDNISDIFEQSCHSNMFIPQLITPGFSNLLNICSITEINYILGAFVSILSKVQTFATGDVESDISQLYIGEVIEHFLNHIYPFLKTLTTSNAPPIFIADIAAALTSLTFRCATSNIQIDFSGVFVSFTRDNVNSSILCRYLCFLFDDELLVAGLEEQIPNINCLMFQCWLKCMLFLAPPNGQMIKLTQKVLLQKDIIETFPGVKSLDFSDSDHVTVTLAFFRTMRQTYEESDLQQRRELKIKLSLYFKSFAASVVSRVSKQCDSKTLSHVYKIVSHLVEFCAPLLYMKSDAATILSNLLDKTYIPHLLYPKDQKSQIIFTSCIKMYLPSILKGLFYLDYKKDSCIDRQIKEVIKNFAFGYSSAKNPFTKLIIDTVRSRPEGLNPETFEFLLETVKKLVEAQKEPSKVIFDMLFEVLQSVPTDKKKVATDILLRCVLEDLMKHDNAYVKSLLRKVFAHFRDEMGSDASKSMLVPTLVWFIEEKLRWRCGQVFWVIGILIEYLPLLFSDIVGNLTKAIGDIEKMRGCGRETNLRDHLEQLLKKFRLKIDYAK